MAGVQWVINVKTVLQPDYQNMCVYIGCIGKITRFYGWLVQSKFTVTDLLLTALIIKCMDVCKWFTVTASL